MKTLTLLTLSLVAALTVNAGDLVVGQPSIGGTGCPAASTYVRSNDYNRFELLYDKFEIDGLNQNSFARSACNIRIPISTPAGIKMVVREVLTEGIYNAEAGDSLQLDQDVWFVGQATRKPLKSELKGSWNYVDIGRNPSGSIIAESNCGGKDSMLAVAMGSMIRKSSAKNTDSYLGVYKTEFEIELVSCN
jgi:hypothetical protein